MRPTPAAMTTDGSAPASSRPSTRTRPAVTGRMPESTSASSVWPLPETPATPTISPACTSSETSWSAGSPWAPLRRDPAHPQARLAARPRSVSCWPTPKVGRPTIMRASSRSSVEPGAVPTMRPRRMTLTRSLMARTSPSLWLMKTTERPSPTSRRSVSKSASTSWGTSTAVGSSRMSTRQSRARALTISTRCCSPTESSSTMASGCDADAEAGRRLLHGCAGRRQVQAGPPVRPRTRFSVDGHGLHQREVLGDHAHAGRDGVSRRADGDGPAVDVDGARVHARQPVEDAHQRRLAGAVLAEQRVDLAARQGRSRRRRWRRGRRSAS